jgi:hypothetical protein
VTDWQPFLIPAISAVASIVAALFAGVVALRIKGHEIDAQRIRDLESRLSTKKLEMYRPAVDLLTKLSLPGFGKDLEDDADKLAVASQGILDFTTWVCIYGSADAVIAYRNFRQAALNNVPQTIRLRLYAELIVAIREDIGGQTDRVTPTDILALTQNDLYTTGEMLAVLEDRFEDACKKKGWTPPWLTPNRLRAANRQHR